MNMNRPTNLGMELRKLRIDAFMNMADMAKGLDMSTSMLSAIEIGKRAVPVDFVQKLVAAFPDWSKHEEYLEELAGEQRGAVMVQVKATDQSRAAAVFARRLMNPEIDPDFLKDFEEFINKRG